MRIKDVAALPPLERFLYWMDERHKIYLRKKAGKPKPWTDDEVLRSNFFTNPYRENDKVTVWFRENIRRPMAEDPGVVFATIAFRWFTWPPTGLALMGRNKKCPGADLFKEWDLQEALRRLKILKETERQVFTGAYNISNAGSTKPKINRVCEDFIQPAYEACNDWLLRLLGHGARAGTATMQGVHELLRDLPGLGGSGFMAYEIVCDLRFTWALRDAPDKCTWANPGPGAVRGINRLLGRDLNGSVRNSLWTRESLKLLATAQSRLRHMPPLEMREIEHSLCEWDKYERARLGDGHMKRKYKGV